MNLECRKGHQFEKRYSDGHCPVCVKLKREREYLNDPEKAKTRWRQYYRKYEEKVKEYSTQYKLKNIERVKKQQKEYREKNRGKIRKYNSNRKAKELGATPHWVCLRALERVYLSCPINMQVDHIIPLQGQTVCGLHVPWNLQYLTKSENVQKKNRLLERYLPIGQEYFAWV